MTIETDLPLVDEILRDWTRQLGDDYQGYRNHVCRVISFCFALHHCSREE